MEAEVSVKDASQSHIHVWFTEIGHNHTGLHEKRSLFVHAVQESGGTRETGVVAFQAVVRSRDVFGQPTVFASHGDIHLKRMAYLPPIGEEVERIDQSFEPSGKHAAFVTCLVGGAGFGGRCGVVAPIIFGSRGREAESHDGVEPPAHGNLVARTGRFEEAQVIAVIKSHTLCQFVEKSACIDHVAVIKVIGIVHIDCQTGFHAILYVIL